MIAREFKINEKTFKKRMLTLLQHKLRTVMKCYTIINFNLLENNKFTFQKSYKKFNVRLDDPKVHEGHFEFEKIPDSTEILLKIYVH
jgi:hypothetical protein